MKSQITKSKSAIKAQNNKTKRLGMNQRQVIFDEFLPGKVETRAAKRRKARLLKKTQS